MPKPELEFFPTESIPWIAVEGAPPGHYQKILTEDPERMFVTRMLKVDPGCASVETFVHDFWEEVYILESSQWDGDQFFQQGFHNSIFISKQLRILISFIYHFLIKVS